MSQPPLLPLPPGAWGGLRRQRVQRVEPPLGARAARRAAPLSGCMPTARHGTARCRRARASPPAPAPLTPCAPARPCLAPAPPCSLQLQWTGIRFNVPADPLSWPGMVVMLSYDTPPRFPGDTRSITSRTLLPRGSRPSRPPPRACPHACVALAAAQPRPLPCAWPPLPARCCRAQTHAHLLPSRPPACLPADGTDEDWEAWFADPSTRLCARVRQEDVIPARVGMDTDLPCRDPVTGGEGAAGTDPEQSAGGRALVACRC